MRFKMITKYLEEEIMNNSNDDQLLIDQLEDLTYGNWDFLILEPQENINEIQYLQTAFDSNNGEFYIELRIGNNEKWKHYQYITNSKEIIISIFSDFFNLIKIPDFLKWSDITDEELQTNRCVL